MNMALSVRVALLPDRIDRIGCPSTMVFMADGPAGYCSTVPYVSTAASPALYNPVARHNGYVNLAFVDGHVGAFSGTYLGVNVVGTAGNPAACNRADARWYWYVPGAGAPWTGP
jgi:prepilin-type processing-associated H-X9-DG protein